MYTQFSFIFILVSVTLPCIVIPTAEIVTAYPGGQTYQEYFLFSEKLTFFEALESCETRGMKLAIGRLNKRFAYIGGVLGKQMETSIWIGGYKHPRSDIWFVDNQDCTLYMTNTGNLDFALENEQCLQLRISNNRNERRAVHCRERAGYLCMYIGVSYLDKTWYNKVNGKTLKHIPENMTSTITTKKFLQCLRDLLQSFEDIIAVHHAADDECMILSVQNSQMRLLPKTFTVTTGVGYTIVVKKELSIDVITANSSNNLELYQQHPCPHPYPSQLLSPSTTNDFDAESSKSEDAFQTIPIPTQYSSTAYNPTLFHSSSTPFDTTDIFTTKSYTEKKETDDISTTLLSSMHTFGTTDSHRSTLNSPSVGYTLSQSFSTFQLSPSEKEPFASVTESYVYTDANHPIATLLTFTNLISQLSNSVTMVTNILHSSVGDDAETLDLNSYTTLIGSTAYCQCSCGDLYNITREELEIKMRNLQRNLTISRKKLSSYKRSKISADDSRATATNIGWVAVTVLITVGGLILMSDFMKVMRSIRG